jgi:hypothetical protein
MVTIEDQTCREEIIRQNLAIKLNQERIKSAFCGNALKFYELTDKTGFPVEPQFQELYIQGEREFLDKYKENREIELESEFYFEFDFVNKVKKRGINVDDVFSQKKEKQGLIEEYGFTILNFKGQKFKKGERGLTLEDCNNEVIGNAFKKIYYSSLRKLEKLRGIS